MEGDLSVKQQIFRNVMLAVIDNESTRILNEIPSNILEPEQAISSEKSTGTLSENFPGFLNLAQEIISSREKLSEMVQ